MIALLAACVSPLPDDTPLVDRARVLAVRATPAEAAAGEEVALEALAMDPDGPLPELDLDWAFCTALRPLAELGPVARSCLEPGGPDLVDLGAGLAVTGALPADACSRFGPNPPPAADGQPAGRPADPDGTGGYYQPALAFGDEVTLGPVRVACGLANVSQDDAVAFAQAYVRNVAPEVAVFEADGDDLLADGVGAVVGGSVALRVAWADCGAGACAGAETYAVWDDAADVLGTRREAVSAAWFTTGGAFAEARNGRSGDDDATEVTNTLTLPDAGPVDLAVVLRDERGGVSWATATLEF